VFLYKEKRIFSISFCHRLHWFVSSTISICFDRKAFNLRYQTIFPEATQPYPSASAATMSYEEPLKLRHGWWHWHVFGSSKVGEETAAVRQAAEKWDATRTTLTAANECHHSTWKFNIALISNIAWHCPPEVYHFPSVVNKIFIATSFFLPLCRIQSFASAVAENLSGKISVKTWTRLFG